MTDLHEAAESVRNTRAAALSATIISALRKAGITSHMTVAVGEDGSVSVTVKPE